MIEAFGTGTIYSVNTYPSRMMAAEELVVLKIKTDGDVFSASFISRDSRLSALWAVGDDIKFKGRLKIRKKRQRDGSMRYYHYIDIKDIERAE